MTTNYLLRLIFILLISNFLIAQETPNVVPPILLEDMTLQKNTTYQIDHQITISNGAILYIEEGVVLQSKNIGDIIFVIDNGSKVVANGSYDHPITAVQALQTESYPTIIMKSPKSGVTEKNTDSHFSYQNIDNPIIVVNTNTFEPNDSIEEATLSP